MSEALRLADDIENMALWLERRSYSGNAADCRKYAAELRRLDEENSHLLSLKRERNDLVEHLQFVERCVNHHGTKGIHSAESILSMIQHYPPVKYITLQYSNAIAPNTPDPYAERDALKAENKKLRADAARYRWLRQGDNDELVLCHGPIAKDYWYLPRLEKLDAAIDVAMEERP